MPSGFGQNTTSGDPIRVFIDGEFRWWDDLSDEQKASWVREHPERYQETKTEPRVQRLNEQQDTAAGLGLPTSTDGSSLLDVLRGAGVDIEDPNVQLYLQSSETAYEEGTLDTALAQLQAMALAQQYPSTPATEYSAALAASGFNGPFRPDPLDAYGPTSAAVREGGMASTELAPTPTHRISSETDFVQFQNGVLVSPDGQVLYEPGSTAPGSLRWRMKVGNWAPDKVSEWRKKLHEMGYMTEDEAKVKGVDATFLDRMQAYHEARYRNGGKPIAGDLASAGPGSSAAPKPVDLNDFSAQIRNDVRDQYERIYGVRPSDGEVQLWSDYIIRHGMQLQRKFRRKYDSPMTDTAASEAEERFVEKLENSPQAQFLRESEEENTQLRDTFERMAQVTASLAS